MIDQSYSAYNFRKLFDIENRKGSYLEGKYFPEVEAYSIKLKRIKLAFRRLKKRKCNNKISDSNYQEKQDNLNRLKYLYVNNRDILLDQELQKISNKVNSKDFGFEVFKSNSFGAKPIYHLNKTPCSYFSSKQLQYNLSKLYDLKQQNKDQIIFQLKRILEDTFPKYIIRTDIKSFYESIDREILNKKLNHDPLLTLTSKRFVSQILNKYNNLSGNMRGVPRGIGISAYLSELYLKEFDDTVKRQPDLLYFARYVDDIVIVFSPKPNSQVADYRSIINDEISGLKLSLNSKTKEFYLDNSVNDQLDYLGYTFKFKKGSVELFIKKEKIKKYKARIDNSINSYSDKNKFNKHKYRKLLVQRIRFLTGNVKLLNSKKSALVGIYHSNKHVDNKSFLKVLDGYLIGKVKSLGDITLERRLMKLKFQDGFNRKTYRAFTTKQLKQITSVWKDV